MGELSELKSNQLAWAMAWQDHGDRGALALLCASVEPFVHKQAFRLAHDEEMRRELICEYRIGVIEAAGAFDRDRPGGFVALCGFHMGTRTKRVFQHRSSPASMPLNVKAPARRVPVDGDTDDGVVLQLPAPDAYEEPNRRGIEWLLDEAGLDAREARVMHRHLNEETLEDVAALWGVTWQRVRDIEQRAMKKVRAVCAARGLTLSDLL